MTVSEPGHVAAVYIFMALLWAGKMALGYFFGLGGARQGSLHDVILSLAIAVCVAAIYAFGFV